MSIVVITIEEQAKIDFVNSLHAKTGGGVELVIVQKKTPLSFWSHTKRFFKKNNSIRALYFALLLGLNQSVREKLNYFRNRTPHRKENSWIPPVIYVASPNDGVVYNRLSEISPSLLVVWGSGMLKNHIIRTAKQTINLHLGLAPYYRGAVGNQFAIFMNDMEHVGATIHHVSHEADSGDIIETILADTTKPPQEMFRTLNDTARKHFCDIAVKLHNGETLPRIKQDSSVGKIYLLKQWTPEIRYKVGKKIMRLERLANTSRADTYENMSKNVQFMTSVERG